MRPRSGVLPFALGVASLVTIGCNSAPSSASPGSQGRPPLLLVADSYNSRVLIFSSPLVPGEDAATVLGQDSFTASAQTTTANGFIHPGEATMDAQGNIWVSDSGNNRVLRFSSPFTNGASADVVLGQPNFTTSGRSTSLSGLSLPHGFAFDKNGNLWVADSYSARVLEFVPPFTNGMAASLALGQPPFINGVCVTPTASTMCYPSDLTFDAAGNLWVADNGDNRVLEFTPPFVSGQSASIVLGQQDFASKAQGAGQAGFSIPWSIASDKAGNLWVSDSGNWRVLEFNPPFSNGQSASLVLGYSNFTTTVNSNIRSSFSTPFGLTFDGAGNLLVADSGDSRVLVFAPPFSNGMDATNVIGQPNLMTVGATVPPTASGLANPVGVSLAQ